MNKLWILRPVIGLSFEDDPWVPWYDKAFGFIVLAKDEDEARKFADSKAGAENMSVANPWLESHYSTCELVTTEGEPCIVMKDFRAA